MKSEIKVLRSSTICRSTSTTTAGAWALRSTSTSTAGAWAHLRNSNTQNWIGAKPSAKVAVSAKVAMSASPNLTHQNIFVQDLGRLSWIASLLAPTPSPRPLPPPPPHAHTASALRVAQGSKTPPVRPAVANCCICSFKIAICNLQLFGVAWCLERFQGRGRAPQVEMATVRPHAKWGCRRCRGTARASCTLPHPPPISRILFTVIELPETPARPF